MTAYDQYRDFLIHHLAHFEKVILVAGNHEFYSSSRTEGLEAAEQLVREPQMNGKLLFLNRVRFDVPDTNVTILGCTLHSHIAPNYTKLTHDFARIKDWEGSRHVKYWLFGHTHWDARFKSGDTVVMSNCRSNDSSRLS